MDINREIEYVNSVYEGIENDKDVYDKYMDGLDKGIILDLGCGIGTVGLVLKSLLNELHVEMVDVQHNAVELAKENKFIRKSRSTSKKR